MLNVGNPAQGTSGLSEDRSDAVFSSDQIIPDKVIDRDGRAESELSPRGEDNQEVISDSSESTTQSYGKGSLQLLVQGEIHGKDTISDGGRLGIGAVSAALNVATGGVAGALAGGLAQVGLLASLNDSSLDRLPMVSKVSDVVTQTVACFMSEELVATEETRYFELDDIYINDITPSSPEYSPELWSGIETNEGLLSHWENYLGLGDTWEIRQDTIAILWTYFWLIVDEKDISDDPSVWDIEAYYSAVFFMQPHAEASASPIYIGGQPVVAEQLQNLRFSDFQKDIIPGGYVPTNANPDCGSRSAVLDLVKKNLDGDSTLEDLQIFMDTLGVQHERDRVRRNVNGILEAETFGEMIIDYPTDIKLFYSGRPRRFEKAVVTNIYD